MLQNYNTFKYMHTESIEKSSHISIQTQDNFTHSHVWEHTYTH